MSWIFSSLKDWVNSFLYKIGLYSKNATIVLLGLDNAGKTTLLYKLKSGAVSSFVPTQRANVEEVQLGSVKFKAWDLGGHEQVRHLWRQYFPDADAILFIVDSSDPTRLAEAAQEFQGLYKADDLEQTPIAILANKSDIPESMSRDTMVKGLGLDEYQLGNPRERPVQLFHTSFVAGTGYPQAFQWITEQL